MTPESISLQLTNAKHDKVFRAWLRPATDRPGWEMFTEWGGRSAGKISSQLKSFANCEAAKVAYDKKVHEKRDCPCSCGCGDSYSVVGAAESAPALTSHFPPSNEGAKQVVSVLCFNKLGQPRDVPQYIFDCLLAHLPSYTGAVTVPSRWAPQLLEAIEAGEAGFLVAGNRYGAQKKYDGVCISLWWPGYWIHGELMPNGGPLMVHDALEFEGHDIREWGYKDRWSLLRGALVGCANVEVPDLIEGEASKLAFVASEHAARGEGVVFKPLDAPYRPGRDQQYKLKFWAMATCLVAAKVGKRATDGHNSLAVQCWKAGKLATVGHITLSSQKQVQPGDFVEAYYLYIGQGGQMYQLRDYRKRDDVTLGDVEKWENLKLKEDHREAA
jgi:hypothetical protein